MIAIDIEKQQELHADQKVIQHIKFNSKSRSSKKNNNVFHSEKS